MQRLENWKDLNEMRQLRRQLAKVWSASVHDRENELRILVRMRELLKLDGDEDEIPDQAALGYETSRTATQSEAKILHVD